MAQRLRRIGRAALKVATGVAVLLCLGVLPAGADADAGAVNLPVEAGLQLIECGNDVYAICKDALYHLDHGEPVRVTAEGGEELFVAQFQLQCTQVNGALLTYGYLNQQGKDGKVILVEGATAYFVKTAAGELYAPKSARLDPVLYNTSVQRHAKYFLADGQLRTLDGHTVSDPIQWPTKDFTWPGLGRGTHWTGTNLMLSDAQIKAAYVLVGDSFERIVDDDKVQLTVDSVSGAVSWAGSYVAMRDQKSGHCECFRLEGAMASSVKLPDSTKSIALFGAGERVFGIHTDEKDQYSILELKELSAERCNESRTAGKLGSLYAFGAGDEWRVQEFKAGSDEIRDWRFSASGVQEITPSGGWLPQTGSALNGNALYQALPPGTANRPDKQRRRLWLMDGKGNSRFVQQGGKALEFDSVVTAACGDGFYMLVHDGEPQQLCYEPSVDSPAQSITLAEHWAPVNADDGTPFKGQFRFANSGGVYVSRYLPKSSAQELLVLDKGVPRLVRTADNRPFTPFLGYPAVMTDSAYLKFEDKLYRVTGTVASPMEFDMTGSEVVSCYADQAGVVQVQTGQKLRLLQLEDDKVTEIELPADFQGARLLGTEDAKSCFGNEKGCWILENGKLGEVSDMDDEPIRIANDSAQWAGGYLCAKWKTRKLWRVKGSVAVELTVPGNAEAVRLFRCGDKQLLCALNPRKPAEQSGKSVIYELGGTSLAEFALLKDRDAHHTAGGPGVCLVEIYENEGAVKYRMDARSLNQLVFQQPLPYLEGFASIADHAVAAFGREGIDNNIWSPAHIELSGRVRVAQRADGTALEGSEVKLAAGPDGFYAFVTIRDENPRSQGARLEFWFCGIN